MGDFFRFGAAGVGSDPGTHISGGNGGARPPIPENSMFLPPPQYFGMGGGQNFGREAPKMLAPRAPFLEKFDIFGQENELLSQF